LSRRAASQAAAGLAHSEGLREGSVLKEASVVAFEEAARVRRAVGAKGQVVDTRSRDGGYLEWFNHYILEAVDEEAGRMAKQETDQERADLKQAEEKRKVEAENATTRFYFVSRDTVLRAQELFPDRISLPRFQTLDHKGFVTPRVISHTTVVVSEDRGEAAYDDVLAISHRWEQPEEADMSGEQLRRIQEYLRENRTLKWVWYDFWCMPQGSKKSVERFEFDEMLHNVNWLFLGARVLILLDLSYLSRFWTQARARAPTDQPSATMAATTLQAPLSPQCECEWLRPLCKPPESTV